MNGSNKHSAFIIGDGFSAFIDGITDQCKHDYSGDEVHFTQSGKTIYWYTYKQWASYTERMRSELIYKHHEVIGDPIMGGAVTCKKCKKIFQPEQDV